MWHEFLIVIVAGLVAIWLDISDRRAR